MHSLALTLSSYFARPRFGGLALAVAVVMGSGAAQAAQDTVAPAPQWPHPHLLPMPPTGAWDSALYASRCAAVRPWLELRRSLHLVHLQLQAQGLELRVQGCSSATARPDKPLWVSVGVWVRDSQLAGRFVRGPLAEGEMLDMATEGAPAGEGADAVQGTEGLPVAQVLQDDDVSPDVHFNRQWLARVMGAQGFAPVPGHWWTFAWQHRGRL